MLQLIDYTEEFKSFTTNANMIIKRWSNSVIWVNVNVNGCFVWQPVQDVPCLSIFGSWDKIQPRDPELDKKKMDGWNISVIIIEYLK